MARLLRLEAAYYWDMLAALLGGLLHEWEAMR